VHTRAAAPDGLSLGLRLAAASMARPLCDASRVAFVDVWFGGTELPWSCCYACISWRGFSLSVALRNGRLGSVGSCNM